MTGILGRLADRVLNRLVPTTTAAAGCTYQVERCYCSRGLVYGKKCMRGCSGVPNHCYSCTTVMGAC
jgi:hypothetical protein